MKNLIIIGASTSSVHAYEFIRAYNLYNVKGFAVDKAYRTFDTFQGLPLYNIEDLDTIINKDEDLLFVALLWNNLNADRKKLYIRLKGQGFKFANLISPTARIRGKLNGDNCWFHDYTIAEAESELGSNIMVMHYALIGAYCKVEDHCFFGAKSVIGGKSTIGEQSFIGINSTVFDDTIIGRKCIVGACTEVKRNMPDFSKSVIGSESTLIRQYTEDQVENKLQFKFNQR